jgi:hypothetical protein
LQKLCLSSIGMMTGFHITGLQSIGLQHLEQTHAEKVNCGPSEKFTVTERELNGQCWEDISLAEIGKSIGHVGSWKKRPRAVCSENRGL